VELKLLWTVEGRNDLKNIYDYHLEVAGARVATKLTASIVLSTVRAENITKGWSAGRSPIKQATRIRLSRGWKLQGAVLG